MDLRQLAYAEAVARHRHFTRAAEELHVAQSALSHQVRRLEAELGTDLFLRTTRSVELTEAGELVTSGARRILAQVDDLRGEVDQLRGLISGSVSVGALPPVGDIDVPGLLARFQADYAGVEVHVRGGVVEEFVRFLNRDELDAAFCLLASELPAGLRAERLGAEELVAALPPDHPLAGGDRVRARDLAGLALISPGPGSALRDAADRFLGDGAGLVRFSLESNDPFLIRGLVSQGFGVALLPRSFAELAGPPLELRPLRPSVRLEVALVWRQARRLSPAARAFIGFVLAGARRRPAA